MQQIIVNSAKAGSMRWIYSNYGLHDAITEAISIFLSFLTLMRPFFIHPRANSSVEYAAIHNAGAACATSVKNKQAVAMLFFLPLLWETSHTCQQTVLSWLPCVTHAAVFAAALSAAAVAQDSHSSEDNKIYFNPSD